MSPVTLYFVEEGHTLASALRDALEEETTGTEFVSCTLLHPLDTFLEVCAPSEVVVRRALLQLKEKIARARRVRPAADALPSSPAAAAPPARSTRSTRSRTARQTATPLE